MKNGMLEKAKIGRLEKFEEKRRGFSRDRRKFGVWAVVSYFTPELTEYRQAYWFPIGTTQNEILSKVPAEIEI